MKLWPGQPYPLGATYDGTGTNFSLFSEVADRRRAVPVRRRRRRGARRPARGRPPSAGTATSRRRPGPALRLPGPRAVRPGRTGSAATRPSCCSTPTPRPSRARSTGTRRSSATRSAATTCDRRRPRQRARSCPRSVVTNPYFDWGDDRPAAHPLARDGHLRGPRQGLHQLAPRRPRGAARHLRRPGPPRRHRAPARASASPPSSCCPSTSSSTTTTWSSRACATTGATTPSASSPPTTTTPPAASAASRSTSSRPWSGRCTRPASR